MLPQQANVLVDGDAKADEINKRERALENESGEVQGGGC
jgi:hypothetical protein